MKKQIINTVMLLALTTGMMANTNSNIKPLELEVGSCTVSYTNSRGIKFSATAGTCGEAYEMIAPHVEATQQLYVPLPTLTLEDLPTADLNLSDLTLGQFPIGGN